jgi:hypothetical protein
MAGDIPLNPVNPAKNTALPVADELSVQFKNPSNFKNATVSFIERL